MELMKKLVILLNVFCLFLLTCQPGKTKNSEKSLSLADSDSMKLDETIPPTAFILDLKANAAIIISLQLTKVDTARGATKIFSGIVLKNYKGDLQRGSAIAYAGMSEKKYAQNSLDTLVVFLTKHKKPLLYVRHKNIFYSTVEENAMIQPYSNLDSLLLFGKDN